MSENEKQQNAAGQLNNNLTGKLYEKTYKIEEKNQGKLTVTNFSTRLMGGDDGGGPLFPWLTEGGQLRQPTE